MPPLLIAAQEIEHPLRRARAPQPQPPGPSPEHRLRQRVLLDHRAGAREPDLVLLRVRTAERRRGLRAPQPGEHRGQERHDRGHEECEVQAVAEGTRMMLGKKPRPVRNTYWSGEMCACDADPSS